MEWHTGRGHCQNMETQGLSQARSARSPGSSAVQWYLWRRSWGHPEWCRMMPFYGGLVCTGGVLQKHTYTHTHTAATTISMQRQTKTDWGPTGGLEMLAAHMQNIQWSCKGSMHPVIPGAVQWHRRQRPRHHLDIQLHCRLSKSFNSEQRALMLNLQKHLKLHWSLKT